MIEAFTPASQGTGSERAGGGEGKSQRVSLAALRWMKALLPVGSGAAGAVEGGAGVLPFAGKDGENPVPVFDGCDVEDCYDCRRRRQAQEAEDVAVWGLLVACLVGGGAAAVSQIWRVL